MSLITRFCNLFRPKITKQSFIGKYYLKNTDILFNSNDNDNNNNDNIINIDSHNAIIRFLYNRKENDLRGDAPFGVKEITIRRNGTLYSTNQWKWTDGNEYNFATIMYLNDIELTKITYRGYRFRDPIFGKFWGGKKEVTKYIKKLSLEECSKRSNQFLDNSIKTYTLSVIAYLLMLNLTLP